jgi:hypothetical protein
MDASPKTEAARLLSIPVFVFVPNDSGSLNPRENLDVPEATALVGGIEDPLTATLAAIVALVERSSDARDRDKAERCSGRCDNDDGALFHGAW